MINKMNIERLTGLVIFELAGKEFCADIRDISAIINPTELYQQNLSEVENKIEINNMTIPLVDLYQIYGLRKNDTDGEKRILVVEIKNKLVGFFVEKVKEILTSSKEFLDNLKFIPYEGKEYLNGALTYEGRKLFLPDLEKLAIQRAYSY